MTYRQALDLVPGDYVLIKDQSLKQTHVLLFVLSEHPGAVQRTEAVS